jgi:C4-dicarboxylate-specific signal transduction histidine kinase
MPRRPSWIAQGRAAVLIIGIAAASLLAASTITATRGRRLPSSLKDDEPQPLSDTQRQGPGMAELAGSLAHELNQPLTAITSNAQAGRAYLNSSDRIEWSEIRDILDDIVTDASRASEIVRGVRALIRGEAPRPIQFDIGEVIDQALALVQADARARGITVCGRMATSLRRAVGDPMEIELVLLNLLVNALEAVAAAQPEPPRTISVTADASGAEIRVSVRDNGTGVPPQALAHIFEPFWSSKPQGMGIGLSFSRALMERNNGHIRAIRNRDCGMTFELTLQAEAAAGTVPEGMESWRYAEANTWR